MAPLRVVVGSLVVAASLAMSFAACGGASHVAPVGPPPEYETPDGPVPVGPAASASTSPTSTAAPSAPSTPAAAP